MKRGIKRVQERKKRKNKIERERGKEIQKEIDIGIERNRKSYRCIEIERNKEIEIEIDTQRDIEIWIIDKERQRERQMDRQIDRQIDRDR